MKNQQNDAKNDTQPNDAQYCNQQNDNQKNDTQPNDAKYCNQQNDIQQNDKQKMTVNRMTPRRMTQ